MAADPKELAHVISDALQEAGYDAAAKAAMVVVDGGKRARIIVDDDGSVVIDSEKEPWDVEHMFKAARLSLVKIRGKLYNVHGLDVWGNEEDGFDVNDVYPSRGKVEIPFGAKHADIVRVLKEDGYIDGDVKPSDVEIDGDEYMFEVNAKSNGRPVYQLRPGL